MELDIINDLIEEELKNANKKFPLFQTPHEAYGVMREELEESNQEFKDIKQGILVEYWELCKNDKKYNNIRFMRNKLLDTLDYTIINNIKELIQLAAMVKKAKMLNNDK